MTKKYIKNAWMSSPKRTWMINYGLDAKEEAFLHLTQILPILYLNRRNLIFQFLVLSPLFIPTANFLNKIITHHWQSLLGLLEYLFVLTSILFIQSLLTKLQFRYKEELYWIGVKDKRWNMDRRMWIMKKYMMK